MPKINARSEVGVQMRRSVGIIFASFVVLGCGGGGGERSSSASEVVAPPPSLVNPGPLSVQEGVTAVAQLRAVSADTLNLTFSVSGGPDQDRFTMSPSGALAFDMPADFELPEDADGDNLYQVTVTALDGNGSDSNTLNVTVTDAFEGRVVDAPIAEASVFVDLNGDGLRSPGEPFGVTDDQGFFSLPPFALAADTDAQVISLGGIDALTGKALPNLSLISSLPADLAMPANLTPLTTVLAAVEGGEARADLLLAIGLPGSAEELLTTDGWQAALAGDAQAKTNQRLNQQLGLLLQAASALVDDGAEREVLSVTLAKNVAVQVAASATSSQGLDLTSATELQRILTEAVDTMATNLSPSAAALDAMADSIALANAVTADPGLDPVSAEVSDVLQSVQSTLLESVAALATGAINADDFRQQAGSTQLFSGVVLAPDAVDTDQDGVADILDPDDDGDNVNDVIDAFPKDGAETLDTDADGVGDNADADDDNDEVADADDAYPLIALGAREDTDGDGRPNDCDEACLALGMGADEDDDNDGVGDADDAFALIPLGGLADADGDGRPNDCDASCLAKGMLADTDDDNDGVLDTDDAYALIPLGALTDTDGDGRPDDCDDACQETGMAADADDDNDGVNDVGDDYPLDSNVHTQPTTAPQSLTLELLPQEENALSGTLTSTAQNDRPVTYQIATQAVYGSATLLNAQTGAFSYTTTAESTQVDNFTYIVNDGFVDSAPSTISVSLKNDPLYQYQWHLNNSGQSNFAYTSGSLGADVNASGAIAAGYTGEGVVVAVVDSGLEIAHEDLADNVVAGSYDFVGGDTDPTPPGSGGDHGTAVAGIVAARGWNDIGPRGVAPKSSLKGYNWLESQSTTNWVSTFGGETYSQDVDIFNNSWGFAPQSMVQPLYDREQTTFNSTLPAMRDGKGAIFVKSAGNDFNSDSNGVCGTANGDGGLSCRDANQDSTHNNPNVIVVGALNADGSRSSYSTVGSALWVSAPGGEYGSDGVDGSPAIMTTDVQGCSKGYVGGGGDGANEFDSKTNPHPENPECNYLSTMNGTSSAAPNVSGVIALMLEANPALTLRDVKHILAETSEQVDAAIAPVSVDDIAYHQWVTNDAGYTYHNYYGFGGVDATKAVDAALDHTPDSLGAQQSSGWISTGLIDTNIGFGVTVDQEISVPTAGVVEYILVRLVLTHDDPSEVGLRLTSPSGTTTTIWQPYAVADLPLNEDTAHLSATAFYGESMAGQWTLSVYDHESGNDMILHSFDMKIEYR